MKLFIRVVGNIQIKDKLVIYFKLIQFITSGDSIMAKFDK